ncbi:hypothetical protein NE237_028922 [Protea cynaroides]|uniref:Uncharacterized protein n=1 Tax=Protea cynaroides TaxID=273540 RepID=A0A9Q0GTC0_9MAGN|nr:hypothetical protein NE237_028922 [Protea cynaroides]
MSSVIGNLMSTINFGSSGREWSSLSMMTALASGSDCAARCYQNPSVRTMDAYMESQTKNKAPGMSEIVAEASVEGSRPLREGTGRGARELGLNHALSQGTGDDTRFSAQWELLAPSEGTPAGDASLASRSSLVSSAIDGLVFWQVEILWSSKVSPGVPLRSEPGGSPIKKFWHDRSFLVRQLWLCKERRAVVGGESKSFAAKTGLLEFLMQVRVFPWDFP